MNPIQEKLIQQVKKSAKELGHSPKKRDIPKVAYLCYKNFGSFNKAKSQAGLEIRNVRATTFPKYAFNIDKDLAQIASYITFDGHLYKNFKGIIYSSKNINDLKEFDRIFSKKFGLPARYHLNSGGVNNSVNMVYFFNKKICEWLFSLGIPKGDKVIQPFIVPEWVYSSKELSREYLKIAFLCEGSFKESAGRTPRITFTTAKSVDLLEDGIKFLNQLRDMLKKFGIDTHEPFISNNHRIRGRDGKMTRDIRFRVKIKDNHKFIREIGWIK